MPSEDMLKAIEKIKQLTTFARMEALRIKACCICSSMAPQSRPCIACSSSDLINSLCDAVITANEGYSNVMQILEAYLTNLETLRREELKQQ